jgi:hypothetical protein
MALLPAQKTKLKAGVIIVRLRTRPARNINTLPRKVALMISAISLRRVERRRE